MHTYIAFKCGTITNLKKMYVGMYVYELAKDPLTYSRSLLDCRHAVYTHHVQDPMAQQQFTPCWSNREKI